MKALGPIHLICRDGKGSRRVPIGIIRKNATEGIRFNYNKQIIDDITQHSFIPYEAFPDLKKTYDQNVLDVFGQRLMRSERNDVQDFYKFWHLDSSLKDDKYYMLAMTQGLLPTDNYEFLVDFNPVKDLVFISEVTGLSHSKVSGDALKQGDRLRYELEPGNPFDKYAVKFYKDDLFLGYMKTIHNRVFYKTKYPLHVSVHGIEKNGILNRVFIKVSSHQS